MQTDIVDPMQDCSGAAFSHGNPYECAQRLRNSSAWPSAGLLMRHLLCKCVDATELPAERLTASRIAP